jgi:hypothetical protein
MNPLSNGFIYETAFDPAGVERPIAHQAPVECYPFWVTNEAYLDVWLKG